MIATTHTSGSRRFKRVMTYAAAVAVLVVMAFPLYGIILTSIQTEPDIRSPNVAFVPTYIEPQHYQDIFDEASGIPVAESMVNSLVVALATAFLTVAIAVPAAYALHRMAVPGRRIILGGLAAIYILPTLLFVLPLFIAVVQLGLYDTYIGLVLPYVAFTLPFMVWIMGSFVRSIPVEVEEMARIDGAGLPQLMFRIVIPLLRPGIFAGLLLGFILAWVEFLTPLLFTSDLSILTVTLGLFRSTMDIAIGQLAAATVITALPVILITAFFQRNISEVVTAGVER
ncbi:MAG: carbohydrate ABC transporter permease [bacterium]|nr:carbohydrate ABC transporter permease [Acidimicrobiia bacterium]MCY4648805.1 carbohydrate ABC transporter permease [bacterium]